MHREPPGVGEDKDIIIKYEFGQVFRMGTKSLVTSIGERGFPYAKKIVTSSSNRIDRDELHELFRRNDSLIEYGESETVAVPEPDASVGRLPEMERWSGTYTISKPFVGVVNGARIVGSPPLAVLGSKYIADASVSPNVQTLNAIQSATRVPKRIVTGNGKRADIDEAVLLHHSWADGYFHWVAESLTRLEGIEKYVQETERRPKLIVGPELNSFQEESLALLGYDRSDLIRWQFAYCGVDRLVVPSMRREIDPPNPSPFSHRWLRETLRERATRDVDTTQFSKRVYISRDDAESRRVVNETDVMDVLEEYGFESYTLSNMTVEETIALFARAECIVAPHGAGLADLIYTEDVSVIEFMPEDRINGIFYMVTKQVDGWYGYLACDMRGVDIEVDIGHLEEIVDVAIDEERPGQIA